MPFALAESDSISGAVDKNMAAQRTACDKNTSMEWSSKYSRCIGKQAAVDTRNEARACDSLTDLAAKQNCHLKLAEKNTALSSDPGSLYQPKTGGSMLLNSAATIYGAYTATNIFHEQAKSGENSNCMSKKIYGITGLAGLASDFYLKSKAKKKVKEIEGKYMLDKKNSAFESQVLALEYLKEEQNTVVEIAGMEKKRNMMLMLGYGLATGWAVYELTPYGANPDCVPKKKDAKAENNTATAKGPAAVNTESLGGAEAFPVKQGSVEVRDLPPLK